MKLLRTKQAADRLGVSAQTVRKWASAGMLPHTRSAANQRLFDPDVLDAFHRERTGQPREAPAPVKLFYVRTSAKRDVSLADQEARLREAYGEPDHVFRDTGSGLNDNRKGLNRLFGTVTQDGPHTVYVTNKDRLTRFGFHYLEYFFGTHDTTIEVLGADSTKEPHEVLMDDFMALLASFSGKFYRLRGWEQQRRLLDDATRVIDNRQ